MQIAGAIIAPVAFIFILYALFMYKRRTIQVNELNFSSAFMKQVIVRVPCAFSQYVVQS